MAHDTAPSLLSDQKSRRPIDRLPFGFDEQKCFTVNWICRANSINGNKQTENAWLDLHSSALQSNVRSQCSKVKNGDNLITRDLKDWSSSRKLQTVSFILLQIRLEIAQLCGFKELSPLNLLVGSPSFPSVGCWQFPDGDWRARTPGNELRHSYVIRVGPM